MDKIRNWISDNAIASIGLFFGAVWIFLIFPLMWFDNHGGGEYVGAIVGFGALIGGALFNAHLERQRDRRLYLLGATSAISAVAMELERNVAILSEIKRTVEAEFLKQNAWRNIKHYLGMLSIEVLKENMEKFTNGAILADEFDSRSVGAYMVSTLVLSDLTRNIVENSLDTFTSLTEEELHQNGKELSLLASAAESAAFEAMKQIRVILVAMETSLNRSSRSDLSETK
tara:strand:+ start:3400 stop:4086 length:687 start_codon:yes stop_codon:yes gene_type:complete